MTRSRYEECISDVERMYRDGWLIKQIAAAVGVTVETINSWIRKSGVYRPYRRTLSPEQRSYLLELYAEGCAIKEISARVGVNVVTVARVAKEAGIVRSRSEAQAVRAQREGAVGASSRGKKAAFQSVKAGGWVAADSAYEYARMIQLEEDPDVAAWCRCADKIPYTYGGVERLYVPDFCVVRSDGAFIEEVKPLKFVGSAVNLAKFSAAEAHYSKVGVAFKVVTEKDIGRSNIERYDGVPISLTPDAERNRKRVEATQRCYAKKTPEQKAEILRRAKEREAAKRAANREEYNRYARERRAKRAAELAAQEVLR